MWFIFALLSAVFAALTSILAKIGIDGVNSNLATAIRTAVVLVMAWGHGIHNWNAVGYFWDRKKELAVFDTVWSGDRRILALLLPRASGG